MNVFQVRTVFERHGAVAEISGLGWGTLLSGRAGPLVGIMFELSKGTWMKGKPAVAELGKAFQVGGNARAKARRWNHLMCWRSSKWSGKG